METRTTAIFVKDKREAERVIENMFNKGYQITNGSFEGKKSSYFVKVIPMDADHQNISHRYSEWKFDEVYIPSNIKWNWEKLAKSRLRDLTSLIKIYQP